MGRRSLGRKTLLQEVKEHRDGMVAPSGPALWRVKYNGQTVEAVGQTAYYAYRDAWAKLEGDPSFTQVDMEMIRELSKEEIAKLSKEESCCMCGGTGKVRSKVR